MPGAIESLLNSSVFVDVIIIAPLLLTLALTPGMFARFISLAKLVGLSALLLTVINLLSM